MIKSAIVSLSDIEKVVYIPLIMMNIELIISVCVQRYKLQNRGDEVGRFTHSANYEHELRNAIIVGIILFNVFYFTLRHYLLAFLLGVIYIILLKMRINQDIVVTTDGILVRGIYQPWHKISRIALISDSQMEIRAKRDEYEIENIEEIDQLSSVIGHYFNGQILDRRRN